MGKDGECNLRAIPKGLADLLRKWQRMVAHRAWAGENDCAWWYGETASVSQLAGAAWALRGWAMEEYAWVRGAEKSRARVDLAVEHPKLKLRFIAEAKQRHPDLASRPRTIVSSIKTQLHAARQQLDAVPRDDWDRVAAVFVSPRVRDKNQVRAATQQFTTLLQSQPQPAIWTFPRWAQALRSDVTGYYYPGAALVVEYSRAPARRAPR